MWTLTEMRVALARHDIGTVFRIMQRHGYPQREIAALTGIGQSEVSEIVCGRRRVVAYTVLDRLVEGFQLPRGWAGLAFDDETAGLRDLVDGISGDPVAVSRPGIRYAAESRRARRRTRGLLVAYATEASSAGSGSP